MGRGGDGPHTREKRNRQLAGGPSRTEAGQRYPVLGHRRPSIQSSVILKTEDAWFFRHLFPSPPPYFQPLGRVWLPLPHRLWQSPQQRYCGCTSHSALRARFDASIWLRRCRLASANVHRRQPPKLLLSGGFGWSIKRLALPRLDRHHTATDTSKLDCNCNFKSASSRFQASPQSDCNNEFPHLRRSLG
jgi:hypothetical protein